MSSFRKVGSAAAALALAFSVPVSAASAAVRAGSAVPTAASANTVGTSKAHVASAPTPWLSWAVMALTAAMGSWIAFHDGDNDADGGVSLPASRG